MQKNQTKRKQFTQTAYWLIQVLGWWTWWLSPLDSSPYFKVWIGLTAALAIWCLLWYKTHIFMARLGLGSVIAMCLMKVWLPVK